MTKEENKRVWGIWHMYTVQGSIDVGPREKGI